MKHLQVTPSGIAICLRDPAIGLVKYTTPANLLPFGKIHYSDTEIGHLRDLYKSEGVYMGISFHFKKSSMSKKKK